MDEHALEPLDILELKSYSTVPHLFIFFSVSEHLTAENGITIENTKRKTVLIIPLKKPLHITDDFQCNEFLIHTRHNSHLFIFKCMRAKVFGSRCYCCCCCHTYVPSTQMANRQTKSKTLLS